MKKSNIGILTLIGIALYFIFKNKNIAKKTYQSKIGARLRKQPNVNSEILKTYQKVKNLKFVKTQSTNDGIWYLVQELFPVGTISPSGEDVGGNVEWTGWLREDVITII